MEKIVFFHMNQLGDLLFSLPVIKAARDNGSVELFSVVSPALAPLLTSNNLVNGVISKKQPFFGLVKDLKKEKFDKAVLFSESPSSLAASFLSGAKERTGFKSSSLSFLLTKKLQRTGVPSLANNKALAAAAGFENVKGDYTGILKVPDANIENVNKWFKENGIDPKKTAAISIGASKKRQNKLLPAAKWAETIDILAEKGVACVLSGALWEKEDLLAVSNMCKSRPKVFAAENGILDSAAFLQSCRVFAGIDSGAMHLAAALGTKCVGVFGPTDPSQIGPMPLKNHTIIKKPDISLINVSDIVSEVFKYF